ncbi:MAG: glycosyl hydrolase [Bacteroidales bacterium]|nr:glycosyl hydrolase [Bacteroidales bacterium]
MRLKQILALGLVLSGITSYAGVVHVGSGSYSDAFPGKDEADRNDYPQGNPQVSGKAANRPIPTNDWWSNELINNHGHSSYAYSLALSPRDNGLVILRPIAGGAMSADIPVVISLEGINSPQTTVCDYSDWTVSLSWNDGRMTATAGLGMPFVYFNRSTNDNVVVTAGMGVAQIVDDNIIVISGAYNGANYAIYAPSGSSWNSAGGNKFTSNLAGKNYWSAAVLPAGDAVATARAWKQYAYVFPADTRAEFTYDENAGKVRAIYAVTPDVKEGSGSTVLMGLLPHHYNNLAGNPNFTGHTLSSVRGTIKIAATNSFTTELRYGGVLPTIPALQDQSSGYDSTELMRLADDIFNNNGLSDWTDSYNDGQVLNRLVQTARICKEAGYEAGFNRGMQLVKNRLERWLTYDNGDIALMFYYHKPYTALLGYPGGHGQDSNINDHHFHWGYFIHAAAFVEQYNPGWANQWGDMVGMLVRDAASSDRNDPMFPYLRSFSPYAGHCWANGFATDPTGNDQESTSESMQFNCSLIHWGAVTGNKAVRDLGVCLYTIERSATEEYWFNVNNSIESNGKALYSRIFGNRYDSENFWGAPIEGSYGIQIYPVHAGSFYLVNNTSYARKLWDAMCRETQILSNQANDNIWYDCWLQFLSMIDPTQALQLYNNCNQLGKKFGISQAQTYQQVHAMSVLGVPRQDISANNPLATAFDNNGRMTYACHNYGDETITVRFSDGYELVCPPRKLTTSVSSTPSKRDAYVTVNLSADKVKSGETVTIDVTIDEGDHNIVKSIIKVNGEAVNDKQHAPLARASKTHSHDWTAPAEAGTYTIVAEAVNAEGRAFVSLPRTVTVEAASVDPVDPVNPDPGPGTHGACVQNAKFDNGDGYTVEFSTVDGNIVVRAKFDNQYTGQVPPYLWSNENGFREYGQFTQEADGWYQYILTNPISGLSFRLKLPISGGQLETAAFPYNPNQSCGSTTGITGEIPDDQIALYPNPSRDMVTVEVPGVCDVMIYSPSGALVYNAPVDTRATIAIADWTSGIYFVRFIDADGNSNVLTLIKR